MHPLKCATAELGAGRHVQLGLDDLAVRFDGLGADFQLVGDLDGVHPPPDQFEDLQLPIGKRFRRVGVERFSHGGACKSRVVI